MHLNNLGFRRAGYCNDNPGSKLLFEKQRETNRLSIIYVFNAPGLLFPALKSSWQMLLEVINPSVVNLNVFGVAPGPGAWHTVCL